MYLQVRQINPFNPIQLFQIFNAFILISFMKLLCKYIIFSVYSKFMCLKFFQWVRVKMTSHLEPSSIRLRELLYLSCSIGSVRRPSMQVIGRLHQLDYNTGMTIRKFCFWTMRTGLLLPLGASARIQILRLYQFHTGQITFLSQMIPWSEIQGKGSP